jgi:AraC-like DNA-binding protein
VISRDTLGVRLLTVQCPEALAGRALQEEPGGDADSGSGGLEALRRVGPVIRGESRVAGLGAALLHQLHTMQAGSGRGGELRLRSRMLDLLGLLVDQEAYETEAAPAATTPRTRRRELIGGLIEAMRRADVSDLSVEDAAQGLHLSVRHFRRLFREQTGQSFHEFLTHLRVEHAKQLLLLSDRKIIEVAWETGYGSLSQFNLVFKKRTGVTPGLYRARHRSRG